MTSCLGKADGELTVTQSLQLTQQCMLSVFSSIAYIREFFDDRVYEDWSFGVGEQQMRAKRLRRGVNKQSDRLLDWIERGCYDAIQRQYLKSAMMGIYEPERKGEALLESYTFHLSYPKHEGNQVPLMLKIQSQGQSREIPLNNRESFRYQLARLMRSVCMLAQRLDPLPPRRHLTMHLEYYEGCTPVNYEPPGFHSALFEPACLFEGTIMRHDFGTALSPFHRLQLSMATTKGSAFGEQDSEKQMEAKMGIIPEQKQTPQKTPPPKTPNKEIKPVEQLVPHMQQVKIQDTQTPLLMSSESEVEENGNLVNATQQIWCACGDAQESGDMIQCDRCNRWQHMACAGFSSCRDTRLSSNKELPYVCYDCRFKGLKGLKAQARFALLALCRKRRIISLMYATQSENVSGVCKAINACFRPVTKLLQELKDEGCLEQIEATRYKRTESEEAKRRMIRDYFGTDPLDLPHLAHLLPESIKKTIKPVNKRFKSIPDLSVHDDHG